MLTPRTYSLTQGNHMKTAAHLREIFGRMGFNDQEIVALAGAHALGRCHADASGYVGPWTPTPTTFNNLYFTLLLNLKWEPNVVNKHDREADDVAFVHCLDRGPCLQEARGSLRQGPEQVLRRFRQCFPKARGPWHLRSHSCLRGCGKAREGLGHAGDEVGWWGGVAEEETQKE